MRGLPNVTYCILTRQSSGNWGRHAKQHAFLYQLWTTRALLNILLGLPNHDSQNSPNEIHELKSWAENEMMCYELESWALTPFCVYMGSFTTGALLNILLGLLNHNSQNSPNEIHELKLWAKNEIMCYELEPWASTPFCVYMGSFGL